MKNKLKKSYIKENTIIAEEDNLIIYDIECMEGSKVQGSVLKTMDVDAIMVSVDIPEEYLKDIFTPVKYDEFVEYMRGEVNIKLKK